MCRAAVIEALERRSIMTINLPGSFMHDSIDELIHVKFEWVLAEMLSRVDSKSYSKYVMEEKANKVI